MSTPLPLSPVCPPVVSCKFCKYDSPLFGVIDFNRHCVEDRRPPAALSGIPIYYHRCPRCGLIFTVAFDHFSRDDFLAHIYNDAYAAVDPDYAETRPAGNAQVIAQIFGAHRGIRLLDYGGGNGTLAERLRAGGFTDVTTYDPFVPKYAARPDRRFDLVVCFEVMEHSTQPIATFDEIDSLLKPDGLLLFSTLLQPADILSVGMSWWYIGPRNGHVTLYSGPALQALLAQKGMHFGSCSPTLHAAWRKVPAFATHFIKM